MQGVFLFLGVIAIVVVMVLLCTKVLPKKLDGTFSNRQLQKLHDYFNFKKLYIESVLKFVFVLATVACVIMGIVGLLTSVFNLVFGLFNLFEYGSWYFEYLVESFITTALGSVIIAVAGPIVLRLIYEGTMMLILLVKNVIEINNKLKDHAQNVPADWAGGKTTEEGSSYM